MVDTPEYFAEIAWRSRPGLWGCHWTKWGLPTASAKPIPNWNRNMRENQPPRRNCLPAGCQHRGCVCFFKHLFQACEHGPAFFGREDGSLIDVMVSKCWINRQANGILWFIVAEINRSLSTLTERQKEVVRYFFGIGVDHALSLEDIGERYNLTRKGCGR